MRRLFMTRLLILLACFLFASASQLARAAASAPRPTAWPAQWISHPQSNGSDYEVLLFRHSFPVEAPPARFVVRVSADNRYRLWVNGQSVATGPQRDDRTHWRYESLDLAPHLQPGTNVLAVQVWNYGKHRPLALMSVQTGLIVCGESAQEAIVNSSDQWRVTRHQGLAPIPVGEAGLNTYVVVGPGDDLDAALTPWGWEQPDFDDRDWKPARSDGAGTPHGYGVDIGRWLAPRNIPLMEEKSQRGLRLRRADGVDASDGFLTGAGALVIPPHTTARLLLDQGHLTTAYPEITFSGGTGSSISVAYAEALFDENGDKGHRHVVEGKRLLGLSDRIRPNGGPRRMFSPMDYRTFRYVEIVATTSEEALSIDDVQSRFTAYPFAEVGYFRSNDDRLAQIWEVGWRTARLCAYETYVDCPYYEQLQYLGDTRIQALLSLYVSGDDRLMRQAIDLFDRSRGPEGLTKSRYPSSQPQVINAFSLFWIGMVHDYYRHRDDLEFARSRLVGIHSVLDWFGRHVDRGSGLLGPLPFWSFVDWPREWVWNSAINRGGEPAGVHTGGSAILTLHYAWALQEAAELTEALGEGETAARYRAQAEQRLEAVRRSCWNRERRYFSDTPDQASFSQHVNALAVLSGAIAGEPATELMQRVLADKDLVQATFYFRFYLLRAAKATGLGQRYLEELAPWYDMLARGLTTFAERPDPTRSDCHAWSASPVYELLATVAGIEPAAPGFRAVRIAPHPGHLTTFEAGMPHPAGMITVNFERRGDRMRAIVTLPDALHGTFLWQGREVRLGPGEQTLEW